MSQSLDKPADIALEGTLLAGRYRLIEAIGRGGFGVVYRAQDERLQGTVAVKVLHRRLLSDEAARAHLREATHLISIAHPVIVTVSDAGTDGDLHYLVMGYVPGISLDKVIQGGPLPEDEVVRLGTQMLKGLSAAHAQGLIHCDLKPANLRVTPEGWVKILDFGLATWIKDLGPARGAPQSTGEEVSVGTPPYMAPEQLRDDRTDWRADIYATGAVLYEMATGKPIFSGHEVERLVYLTLNETPVRPRRLNPKLSQRFERTIMKALAKRPEDRQRNAGELTGELESADGSRTRSWVKWVFAGALLLTLAGVGWSVLQHPVEPRLTWVAVLPFEHVSGDTAVTRGIKRDMLNQLATMRPDRLRVKDGTSAVARTNASADPFEIGRQLAVDYLLWGSVEQDKSGLRVRANLDRVRDQSHVWGDEYPLEGTNHVYTLESKLATRIARTVLPHLVGSQFKRDEEPTRNSLAHEAYVRGREHWERRSETELNMAIRYFEQAIARDSGYAQAHAGLADAYLLLAIYEYVPAREAMPEAKREAWKAIDLDESLAEAHTSLAAILESYEWDWPGAGRHFQRAIERDPSYPTARQWYADYLANVGRMKDAIEQIEYARTLDPFSPSISTDVAVFYLNARQYDRAVEQCHRTLDSLDATYPYTYSVLGRALWQKGRFSEAVVAFQNADRLRGAPSEDVEGLGVAFEEAGPRGFLHRRLQVLARDAEAYYVPPYAFASLHAMLGERDQAFAWLEKAYEERSVSLVGLNVDVTFDRIRADPRFPGLLHRIGLTP